MPPKLKPLPRELPQEKRENPYVVSAYNQCLKLEASLQQNLHNDHDIAKKLIYVRIPGYLLHHVPSEEWLQKVVAEVISCGTDEALLQLGIMYFTRYIMAFRANKCRTPIPSNNASPPSFDTIADMINDTLDDAPQSHTTAKKKALIRDGYRCVVSRKYDASSLDLVTELRDQYISDRMDNRTCTECAHIFSESTNADIEPGLDKRDYAATMWAEDLNGSTVHRLENVMTLDITLRRDFDNLSFWFNKIVNKDDTYELDSKDPLIFRDLPKVVTFTTPDPVNLPVPSPTYLVIHAACAKVAHLSGAAEYIDKFYRDMEDGTTLNADGSSADVLEHALFELRAAGYSISP